MDKIRLHLDSRNRISLTRLLPSSRVSSFKAYRDGNKIILEPMIEIPADEAWLYENPEILKDVYEGLSQDPEYDLGSFKDGTNDGV